MGSIIKGIDRDVRFVEIEIWMNFEKVGPVLLLLGAGNVSHDNVCRIDIFEILYTYMEWFFFGTIDTRKVGQRKSMQICFRDRNRVTDVLSVFNFKQSKEYTASVYML